MRSDADDAVLTERRGPVFITVINRPAVLNAINPTVSAGLRAAFIAFRDDSSLLAAVLTGSGERAFSTGNDLRELHEAQARGDNNVSAALSAVPFGGITRDYDCTKPIIAAINGYCLAGGLELALCCDIRIAGSGSQFGFPEVSRGLVPGAGGTQRLPRVVGPASALEMILTGARFDAPWALSRGLVNEVVAPLAVVPRALEIAELIAKNAPVATQLSKRAVTTSTDLSLDEGLALERTLSRQALGTWDAEEGPRAFAEKRAPTFRGK